MYKVGHSTSYEVKLRVLTSGEVRDFVKLKMRYEYVQSFPKMGNTWNVQAIANPSS